MSAPGNYLEEQLAYRVALTLQQWNRLDRSERVTLVRSMENREDILHPLDETAQLVMKAGVHALRERSALATRILELATVVMSMDSEQLVEPTDARLLLNGACLQANGKAGAPAIAEPPQWNWGALQERLTSLSEASGKSVEKILLAVCRRAAEERQEAEEALDQGVAAA